jgi:hypothetical protein
MGDSDSTLTKLWLGVRSHMLTKEAALPCNLIALLVKLGKMPDEFKVSDQAKCMHGANLVLGFIERIRDCNALLSIVRLG